MERIGRDAVEAARVLALANGEQRNAALAAIAAAIRADASGILAANARDLESGRAGGLTRAQLDRLMLDAARVEGIARAVEDVVALPDPLGRVSEEWRDRKSVV